MTLGTRLLAARKAKRYGLREVERLTGVPIANISRAERDLSDLHYKSLWKLAKCYGVDVVDLVAPDEEMPEMSDAEVDAFLIAHGYNLDQLRDEINALIEQLKVEAREIMTKKEQL